MRSEKHGLDVSQFGGKAGWSDLRRSAVNQPPQKFVETLSGPPEGPTCRSFKAPVMISYLERVLCNELCEACQSGKAGHLMQLFIKSNLAGIDFLISWQKIFALLASMSFV